MTALIVSDTLHQFDLLASDDSVKTDLELTCSDCGAVVCDVEPGDNLKVLVSVANEHVCDDGDGAPCCPDPACGGNPCTFPGYADNH